MGAFITVGAAFGGALLIFFPMLMLLERTMVRDLLADRKREWKVVTTKQVVVYYQMAYVINEIRKQLGQSPWEFEEILPQEQRTWSWNNLLQNVKSKAERAVQSTMARVKK